MTLLRAAAAFAQLCILDTTPPTVSLPSLSPGAVVPTGLIVRADAADDLAVAGVRFLVDGVDIAGEISVPPYWTAWDTSSVAEGPHTLRVVARDLAGNIAATELSVTVDRTPPAVAMASPMSGSTLSDIVTVAANVSDSGGVDRVSFSANGVPLAHDAVAPYEVAWDTTLIPDGSYTLEVTASDRAGGLNRSAVTVTVANGTTRIQEADPAIAYSGVWSHGNEGLRAWSADTASYALLTMFSAQATFNFEGTGVTWIGFRGPQAGIARVVVDGAQVATVDLYHSAEHVQAPVFTLRGLAPGPHTLTVEATGHWNPMSVGPYVVVDSFIVFQ